MGHCCSKCFTNKYIQDYIEEHADSKGICDYCGAQDVALIGTDVLGEHIRECICKAYVDSEEGSGAFFDPDFHVYCGRGGKEAIFYSVREVMTEGEFALSDTVSETSLLEDLMHDSAGCDHDDFDQFYDPDNEWLLKKYDVFCHDADVESEHWQFFKEFLCCASAFSDTPFENPRAKKYLDTLWPHLERFAGEVHSGDVFYRAREKGTLELSNMNVYKELAPAPQRLAKSGRMNEAGVPRLYVASDTGTAITECKATDKDCLVAKYVAKEVLPIIDFSKALPSVHKSIFNPDFKDEDLWLGDFLHGLTMEISKPVRDNAPAFEYNGTQAVAEYIRSKHFCGICFNSSVSKGKSYVFFCGPDPKHQEDAYSFLHDLIYVQEEILLPPAFTDWFDITEVKECHAESHLRLAKTCEADNQ